MGGWIQSWTVIGSTGNEYKVSTKADGTWGCSCKAWTTARAPKPDCKHIRQKREELGIFTAAEWRRPVTVPVRDIGEVIKTIADNAAAVYRTGQAVGKKTPVVRSTEEGIRELESLERRGRITYAQRKLLRGLRLKLECEQRQKGGRSDFEVNAADCPKIASAAPPRRKIRLDD